MCCGCKVFTRQRGVQESQEAQQRLNSENARLRDEVAELHAMHGSMAQELSSRHDAFVLMEQELDARRGADDASGADWAALSARCKHVRRHLLIVIIVGKVDERLH